MDLILCRVLDASFTACWAASSQLLVEFARISITFTTGILQIFRDVINCCQAMRPLTAFTKTKLHRHYFFLGTQNVNIPLSSGSIFSSAFLIFCMPFTSESGLNEMLLMPCCTRYCANSG